MKFRAHPTFVTSEHSYTRSSEPWLMDAYNAAEHSSSNQRNGWRLFHYLSGGGMRILGRTMNQEIRSRRQTRFLVIASVVSVVWLCLLVF